MRQFSATKSQVGVAKALNNICSAPHLHPLQHTVEAGRLAGSGGSGNVETARDMLLHLLLQKGPDGRTLGLPGQEAFWNSGVERLLYTLKPRLWRRNGWFEG